MEHIEKINLILTISIPALLAIITTLGGCLYKVLRTLRDERERHSYKIIGVYGEVPDILSTYKDYWSLRKLKNGVGKIRILMLRNLSYGLRKCDWVVADHGDGKVIAATDIAKIKKVILDEDLNEAIQNDVESESKSKNTNSRSSKRRSPNE